MGEVVAGEDDAGDGVSEKVRNWVSEFWREQDDDIIDVVFYVKVSINFNLVVLPSDVMRINPSKLRS